MHNTFLLEIGTEELPPFLMQAVSEQLALNLKTCLHQASLAFESLSTYAAPRRIAVKILGLANKQADKTVKVIGPNTKICFNADKSPTKALLGFLKSNNLDLSATTTVMDGKNEKICAEVFTAGKTCSQLLPEIITASVAKLQFAKPMRWCNHDFTFIRPVHWIVCMLNSEIIPVTLFTHQASNQSFGHRFHSNQAIALASANDYPQSLESHYVLAEFATRKTKILEQIAALENKHDFKVDTKDLIDEVTALVEWPVALVGEFDAEFLNLPQEIVISELKHHQRYFPVYTKNNELINKFIVVSNIESKDPKQVVLGNKQVLSARLKDGVFLWQQDLKSDFKQLSSKLQDVAYQHKLGSMLDKVKRIKLLATEIAITNSLDKQLVQTAASLCKNDLVTSVVFEFPELQGIIGGYYAKHIQLGDDVANAIAEHYKPINADDTAAESKIAACIAIADKFDHLCVNFALGNIPSGDKDFYALRRQALGIIKTVLKHKLEIDFQALINLSLDAIDFDKSKQQNLFEKIYSFLLSRMKFWYQQQNIDSRIFNAIVATKNNSILTISDKVALLQQYQNNSSLQSLAANYKRVNNILNKNQVPTVIDIDSSKFKLDAESKLFNEVTKLQTTLSTNDYNKALAAMLELTTPLADFFDSVMVIDNDIEIRNNRLALLSTLQQLFLQIADLSEL